jgi:hypothetical protein
MPVDASGTCVSFAPLPLSYKVECKGCFSPSATAQLISGAVVPYSELKVGDRVLSASADGGQLMFDKVFRIAHQDADIELPYMRISVAGGQTLEVTGNHMMHVGTCCDLASVRPARDIHVGDTVFGVVSGNSAQLTSQKVTGMTVTDIQNVKRMGAFNVHTLQGNMVVNGMLATHFTEASSWGDATRSYAPVWYRMLDFVNNFSVSD